MQVEHPNTDVEMQWRKAVSLQRKRAVMACFRMIPVYNISRSASSIFCSSSSGGGGGGGSSSNSSSISHNSFLFCVSITLNVARSMIFLARSCVRPSICACLRPNQNIVHAIF